jgi:predicted RNA methylase
MDLQTERWPHVDIVRAELHRLQTEMTVSEQKALNAHYAQVRRAIRGQTYVSNFTQVMLEKGNHIYERLQNGGTIPN